MIPNPSQPSRSAIMCGMKIRKFIERIKRNSKVVNRLMNGSFFI